MAFFPIYAIPIFVIDLSVVEEVRIGLFRRVQAIAYDYLRPS
jgi:hypothetical protein